MSRSFHLSTALLGAALIGACSEQPSNQSVPAATENEAAPVEMPVAPPTVAPLPADPDPAPAATRTPPAATPTSTPAPSPAPSPSPTAELAPERGATIPPRFRGEWNRELADCGTGRNPTRLRIGPGRIRFYESVGEVLAVSGSGRQITVRARYTGEGETWTNRRVLRLSPSGDWLTIDGMVRRRCP